MNKGKKILQKQIRKLQNEFDDIEDKERLIKAKTLVGKCFKYHNSYSCPQSDADRWWLYIKVKGIKGCGINIMSFEEDCDGKAIFSNERYSPYLFESESKYISISEEEFKTAWGNFLNKLTGAYKDSVEQKGG